MTALLEQAFRTTGQLPAEMQDEVARMMLAYAGAEAIVVELTAEEETAVLHSRAAAARGEFATHEQMRAIWGKHGL